MLEKEYEYYRENKEKLLSEYDEKYIVIVGESVVGVYDTEVEALSESLKVHEAGTFMLQHCIKNDDHAARFHSRVVFESSESYL